MYFLEILFMFTGENGLMCYFCPDDGIWESETMMEAAVAMSVLAGGDGAAQSKTVLSGVASLLRVTGQLVAS